MSLLTNFVFILLFELKNNNNNKINHKQGTTVKDIARGYTWMGPRPHEKFEKKEVVVNKIDILEKTTVIC